MSRNRIHVVTDNSDRLRPVLFQTIKSRLREVRAENMRTRGHRVEFTGGMFRIVLRWNLLICISRGSVEMVSDEEGLDVHYGLSFTQAYLVGTIVLAIPSTIAVFAGVPLLAIAIYAGIMWLWMVGMNILIAKARFDHFLRKCIRRAREQVGDEHAK